MILSMLIDHIVARRSEGLAWLSDIDVRSNHLDALQLREPGTGQWLLDQDLFKSWEEGSIQSIWLHGMRMFGFNISVYRVC